MKAYLKFNINERINFKSYFLTTYGGMKYVLNEAEYNPAPYHKSSPFPLAWDKY